MYLVGVIIYLVLAIVIYVTFYSCEDIAMGHKIIGFFAFLIVWPAIVIADVIIIIWRSFH